MELIGLLAIGIVIAIQRSRLLPWFAAEPPKRHSASYWIIFRAETRKRTSDALSLFPTQFDPVMKACAESIGKR
jgi:hypothetical protein